MTTDNKKLSSMKQLLVRAWRERWTDTQWSIHSKAFVSDHSDATILSDLLLSQAMVGMSGNHLIMSYFKHAISTQLIPYNIAIESITKFEDVSKVYCVKTMTELVRNMIPNIAMNGNFEDSWKLVKSSVLLLKWTVETTYKCLHKVADDNQAVEYGTVVTKCSDVLLVFASNQAVQALLHIAYLDEIDLLMNLRETLSRTRELLQKIQSQQYDSESVLKSLAFIDKIGSMRESCDPVFEQQYYSLNPSINVLLHHEALLNSVNTSPALAEQLILIEKLQGLSRSDLYCEVLRSGYMGMLNSVASADELRWAAFVYLKVPQVFSYLYQASLDSSAATDVEQGLSKFIRNAPLLNLADSKCACDCLQLLLGELLKHNVITESVQERVMLRRNPDVSKLIRRDADKVDSAGARLIVRAESTVTLDCDHTKNQDGLFGVVGHMMSGKSFELILTAAAATGKLPAFTAELIKLNEFARAASGESGRQSVTRSLLFDMSFLMLCHIAQTYGMSVFARIEPSVDDTFFVQWAMSSLPENGQYRSVTLLAAPEELKVDSLMQQLVPGAEFKTSLTKWNEVCHNMPHALHEVLIAWEYGAISEETVQGYVQTLKTKMCCLPIVVATYLCSYTNLAEEKLRAKPIKILEMLLSTSQVTEPQQPSYLNERIHLMQMVTSRIAQNILPPSCEHKLQAAHVLPLTKPVKEMLKETWREMFEKRCINNGELLKFEQLRKVVGPGFFCQTLMIEAVMQDRPEDLYQGTCMLYSLFNLDPHGLTLALLGNILPELLSSGSPVLECFSGLRGVCLARLAIMLIILLQKLKAFKEPCVSQKGRKRTRPEWEAEDVADALSDEFDLRPTKMRRVGDSWSKHGSTFTSSVDLLLTEDGEETVTSGKDPLNKTLGQLFKLFNGIVVSESINQRTSFVQAFVYEMIKCDTPTTTFLAQFIPPNMVSQLLKSTSHCYDFDVILRMCNLTNLQGRRIAAKVICQNERLKKKQTSNSAVERVDA